MAMSFSRAPEELPVYRKHAIETLKAPSELPVTGDSYGVYSNFVYKHSTVPLQGKQLLTQNHCPFI
jgi:hypothetical protein